MKRLLRALLLFVCLSPLSQAADKVTTLLIHPDETIYARFEVKPKKITLISTSKEPDAQAQVIFTLTRDVAKGALNLKVENKFPRDLLYRAEIRAKTRNLRTPFRTTPVVAGKLAFETMPGAVEELAAFDFKLQK